MSSQKKNTPTNYVIPQQLHGFGDWNGAPQLPRAPLSRSTPPGLAQHTPYNVTSVQDRHKYHVVGDLANEYQGILHTSNQPAGVPHQRTLPAQAQYSSILTTSPVEISLPSHQETESWLRNHLKIPAPRLLNLCCLRDITSVMKLPNLTDMIFLAIWGSSHKRLGLSEIYTAIEDRYPVLKTHEDKAWQRSIRHRLSLKACFVRVRRDRRGADWMIDVSRGLGNGRGYKPPPPANTSGSSSGSRNQSDDDATSPFMGYSSESDAFLTPPPEMPTAIQEYAFMSSGTSIGDLANRNMNMNYDHVPY